MNLQQYITANPNAALVEVHAVTEPVERMITPDMVVAMLTEHDSVLSLQDKAKTDDKAAGFLLALNGAVTEYNVMISHPVGQGQQLLLTYLLSISAITEAFKLAMIGYANYQSTPFATVTQPEFDAAKAEVLLTGLQEVSLPNSTEQKVYTLSIANTAPKATTIKIMQRFGVDANDLTEWHQVGQFSNVQYKQQSYKAQIGQCSCAYRELKVVSEYLLDMSVS